MYEIDLKLPNACKSCGYKCCEKHYKNCFKPIFSGEFCNRDKMSICKSYPLFYDGRFKIYKCFGFDFLPKKELFSLIDKLNKMNFYEVRYESEEIILSIKWKMDKDLSFLLRPSSPLFCEKNQKKQTN